MDNLSAVESIFLAALEKASPEDRAAYLDQACGKEGELRRQVERLLRAHPQVGGFLQAATVDEPAVTERPGTVIGPYKLMEQIGEGGMGLVFVAEQQQPVRRKVALKLIKPGMDTRDVIARFEAERQALALMDHPNIARVLDAGATVTGRPYFVMELVKGVPITDFCDQNQLTPRERLGLFVSVCQAVQHAHSKGVIHRDIKPSNVLVTLHDGAPVVKVIDFGVAKAVGQSLTDKTVYTRFAQMIGTPLYMSPEQAQMDGLDVDTRCDVYALGVLLYELLTGTTPFDQKRLQKAAFDEVRRILREEEPPKPSTRLTTLGESMSAVSARRKMEPKKLSALVKGDLDWIVMKALEKDRNRRYETASAFAADVRRYLGEEPVEARPPSALYRFGKLARRNRVALTTAAVVAAALVAGIAVSSWEAAAAWRAEGEAQDAKGKALTAKAQSDDHARLANDRKEQIRAANADLRRGLYGTDMTLIPAAWEADDLPRFDQMMHWRPEPEEADVRGFEWYYWNRQRNGELRTVAMAGGFQDCQGAALSPDGKWFAAVTVVDGAGEFRLWDAATGAVRRTLLAIAFNGQIWQGDPVPMVSRQHVRMVFSPDGRRVALSVGWLTMAVDPSQPTGRIPDNGNREIYVWDTAKGDELCHLSVQEGGSRFDGFAFTPGGKQLAFVIPPRQGVPPPGGWQPEPNRVRIVDTAVSCFPTAPAGANVYVLNVDDHKAAFTLSATGTPRELAFSPDGGRIAVGAGRQDEVIPDDGNRVEVWDTTTRKETHAIFNKQWLPNGLAFSPDGARLAVVWKGPKDETLSLHDAGTGKEIRTQQGAVKTEAGTRPQPVFSADGRLLTYPANGSLVHVWYAASGTVLYTARGHARTPAVAFTPDGVHLITAGREGAVKEWAKPAPWYAPDDLFATGALGAQIKRSFAGTMLPEPNWSEMSRTFSPLASACTQNGVRLARAFLVGEGDKMSLEVRIGDENNGSLRAPIKAALRPSKISRLLFNKDGSRLVANYVLPAPNPWEWRSGLKVWDVASGKELLTADSDNPFSSLLAVSPDGSRVAWNASGGARVLDVASGRALLEVKEAILTIAAFNADGSRIAWGTMDSVRVWDVDAAREVLTIHNTGGPVGLLAFSPDGSRLAGAVGPVYVHGEMKVWDGGDGHELLSLKGQQSVQDIAFSPDGRRLAAYRWRHDNDGDHPGVTLWDGVSGLPMLQLDIAADRGAGRLEFQPDGGRLVLVKLYPQTSTDAYQVWDAAAAADEPRP